MTLDQLRMLVQVEQSGSVLAAAEALGRTQPTVSVAIRKLEEELGLELLSRDHYRARLTAAGEKFVVQARRLLLQTDALASLAGYMAQGHEAELNIAIEASCPLPLILDVLKQVEKKYPQTQFNLMAENIWGALTRLRAGEADLAISPWFEEDNSLQSFVLMHETMIAVAAPNYVAAGAGGRIDYETMKQRVQVIVRDSSRTPTAKKIGVMEQGRHWLVNDHTTKKEILLAGMGWGRLQRHLIAEELADGRLVPLHIENYDTSIDIEIRVARRLEGQLGPVAAELWDDFRQLKIDQG